MKLTLLFLITILTLLNNLFASNNNEVINLGQVTPFLYRGAKIGSNRAQFQYLKTIGVNNIVNLESLLSDDQNLCNEFNIKCISFPISLMPLPNADLNFNYDNLIKAFQYVNEATKNKKTSYIHCFHGSDRTGALAAAIQIKQIACKKNYNVNQLRTTILNNLTKHKFHSYLYPTLLNNILSWTIAPPSWICE